LSAPLVTIERVPTNILKSHSTRVVYSFDLENDEVLIVKEIHTDSWQKRIKELMKLTHEYAVLHEIQYIHSVPRVLGRVGMDGFCMEYIPSRKKECLTIEEMTSIKKQLLDLSKALHRKGIYHRDIGYRGNNILITEDLTPYLIDFGNAIKLGPVLNKIIGPLLGRKDYARVLGWAFQMHPDLLTKEELEYLLHYKTKLSRLKGRDELLENIHSKLF
jgi:serine/threonine protein kinase